MSGGDAPHPDTARPVPDGPPSLRVDKWLFHARIMKSRSLAAKCIGAGLVRVNGEKTSQPSRAVKPGDTLTVTRDNHIGVYFIRSCGTRRGPAPEAQLLYDDNSPPRPLRSVSALDRLVPVREPGSGRPTKRERRALDQLRDTNGT